MFSFRSLQRKIRRSLKRRGLLGTLKRGLKEPFYMILEYRPSRLRWKRRDNEFDRRFGVDTAGTIPLSALDVDDEDWEYGFSYEATDPKYFKAVVGELPIKYEKFTFIDFGSGKGRVLLLAADFPFPKDSGSRDISTLAPNCRTKHSKLSESCGQVRDGGVPLRGRRKLPATGGSACALFFQPISRADYG
jgi:hypothetical protein